MIIDVVCTVCEHEVEIAEFVTEECPNCGCKIEYDEYCIEDFSDCWVSVYFIKPKELSPENIIEHLMNNVEGLHGLEIELLEMIKQYGVDIYKQGWNDCIDEQTTQKL